MCTVSNHLWSPLSALDLGHVHIPCLMTTLHINTYETQLAGCTAELEWMSIDRTIPVTYLDRSYSFERDFAFSCCLV